MKFVKAIALAVCMVSASVSALEVNEPAVFNVEHQAEPFCALVVHDGDAGIMTESMEAAGTEVDRGEFSVRVSSNMNLRFDVDEEWTSLEPWGGQKPEVSESHIVHKASGNDYVLSIYGVNTGYAVPVSPSKDPNFNTFEFYHVTSDFWMDGLAAATITLNARCEPR